MPIAAPPSRSSRSSFVLAALVGIVGCGDASRPTTAGTSTGASTGSTAADTTQGPAASSSGAAGSTTDEVADSSSGEPEGCWDDLAFGASEVFYQGFSDGSEGMAFGADGNLYATTTVDGDGTVWRLDASGGVSEHASVPYALGLARLADGGFVVASLGVGGRADGAVYRVGPDGSPTSITTEIDSPNFIAIAPDGSALVSDDFDTRVFRVQLDGTVSVVIADVPSPNGMAYGPAGDRLFVASTFSPDGQLTRYDVDAAGMPIEASAVEIMQLGPGSTPDGIAVDVDGFVYVAANLQGRIWRVDGAATELVEGELVAEGLGSPASLAFGRGAGFDPCSIYLTQLFGNQILRVGIGVEGAPLFD